MFAGRVILQRRVLESVALIVLLGPPMGCSREDPGFTGTPPPPPPHEGKDEIVFRAFTLEDGGREQLRWVGTADGPLPESPEQTTQPWIGYARPFRIEWSADSEAAPIEGFRYRASQSSMMPFLPLGPVDDPVYDDTTSFSYANDTSSSDLATTSCDGGPDCPERLRWDTGEYTLEVLAVDRLGNTLDPALGLLRYQINYPPVTLLPLDEPDGCGAPESFPQYEVALDGGGTLRCSFAPGDTIPVGATVRVRLDGFDRIAANVLEDSFCCDVRIDDTVPEVLHQGRLLFSATRNDGLLDSLNLTYSRAIEADVLEFPVGPFDYIFRGRVKDGYQRAAFNEEEFAFVSGFTPRVTGVEPAESAQGLLRRSFTGETWPQNDLPHTVQNGVTRFWSTSARDWFRYDSPGRLARTGAAYRIGLVFEGVPHPAESQLVVDSVDQGFVGGVRSWAYELVSEYDPLNRVVQGGGFDRLDEYLGSSLIDEQRLEGEEAWEIFVPDFFWTNPELFDPEGACPDPVTCEMGERMLADLGAITLRVRARTVSDGSTFRQLAPSDPGLLREISLQEYGRRSELVERRFEVRLGLADAEGQLDRVWPSP